MPLLGKELYWNPKLGVVQRWYCRLLGVPIVGLRIRVRRIRSILPTQRSHVLDAGCGRGVISRYLAGYYPAAQIDALDTDTEVQAINTKISQSIGLTNCRFITGDLNEFVKPEYYDLIVSVDNLEHIDDDRRVIRNFFQSLDVGGVLVVHVPHYYRRWPVFSWKPNFDVPGHYRLGYHMPEIVEKIEAEGFDILDKGFSYGFLENLSNNLSYFITKAEERNIAVYALLFPFLNALAWAGQWSKPNFGAGVWLVAQKQRKDPQAKESAS